MRRLALALLAALPALAAEPKLVTVRTELKLFENRDFDDGGDRLEVSFRHQGRWYHGSLPLHALARLRGTQARVFFLEDGPLRLQPDGGVETMAARILEVDDDRGPVFQLSSELWIDSRLELPSAGQVAFTAWDGARVLAAVGEPKLSLPEGSKDRTFKLRYREAFRKGALERELLEVDRLEPDPAILWQRRGLE